jgi:hypothetical protein
MKLLLAIAVASVCLVAQAQTAEVMTWREMALRTCNTWAVYRWPYRSSDYGFDTPREGVYRTCMLSFNQPPWSEARGEEIRRVLLGERPIITGSHTLDVLIATFSFVIAIASIGNLYFIARLMMVLCFGRQAVPTMPYPECATCTAQKCRCWDEEQAKRRADLDRQLNESGV